MSDGFSEPESLSVPLVFLRPIGIAAADAMRLAEAAKRLDGIVRWRLAPAGVMADVYMAHANRVSVPSEHVADWSGPDTAAAALIGYEEEEDQPSSEPVPLISLADSVRGFKRNTESISLPSSSLGLSSSYSGFHKLELDEHGWYKDHPVCILGSTDGSHDTGEAAADLQVLRFPTALHHMVSQLRRIEHEIIGIRMLYQIGRLAWDHRDAWRTSSLHVHHDNRLVAVIEPRQFKAHILEDCRVQSLEMADVVRAAPEGGSAGRDFHSVSLEWPLWELAKRCPEEMLAHVVPQRYLQSPLSPGRAPELNTKQLGEHCTAVLRALDIRPMTAMQLKNSLRLQDQALLRVIASLAIIRAIRVEPEVKGLLRWLPRRLKRLWTKPTATASMV